MASAPSTRLGVGANPRVVSDEPDSFIAAASPRSLAAHIIAAKATNTPAAQTNARVSSAIGAKRASARLPFADWAPAPKGRYRSRTARNTIRGEQHLLALGHHDGAHRRPQHRLQDEQPGEEHHDVHDGHHGPPTAQSLGSGERQAAGRGRLAAMNPADRVRFVTETARAVLAGRLDPTEAAAAVELQAQQLLPLLRSDRNDVTRSEAESVANQLRLLAEQIADRADRSVDDDPCGSMAASIGTLAQALR